MHIEIVAFGRRFLTVFQLDKLEEEAEEIEEEPEAEEQTEPAHYIPTPMREYPEKLGYRLTGNGGAFEREVN